MLPSGRTDPLISLLAPRYRGVVCVSRGCYRVGRGILTSAPPPRSRLLHAFLLVVGPRRNLGCRVFTAVERGSPRSCCESLVVNGTPRVETCHEKTRKKCWYGNYKVINDLITLNCRSVQESNTIREKGRRERLKVKDNKLWNKVLSNFQLVISYASSDKIKVTEFFQW